MELLNQPGTRKIDAMSRRKYTIRREAGLHLTDRQREMLGTAWNGYVNRCARISLRHFARVHNIPYSTWQRELRRGAASPIVRRGNRWTYPEYDIDKARASINEGRGNMGAPMKLTVGMAILFRHAVLKLRRSPYDARIMIKEAMPDRDVPCLKTFYNHIEAGDTGVFRGQTPYHPGRRRKARQPAHEARTVPGRRLLGDRPKEASEARELGHWEMDTVISGRGSRGGLLVMLDRVFKAETYYTRAYASYEKGAIENCNRLVRRWYPKGTDFNQLTRRQIRQLEDWINSIHRESLNGETAYAYDSRMAQAA